MTWRVLHLVSTSDIGGTERSLLYHLEEGVRAGGGEFAEEIACFQGGGDLIREARALGVPAEHLEIFSPTDWALRARGRVRDLLRRRRPDLIHIYGLRADVIARGLAKASGARVASAIHSTDPWRKRWHVWLDRATARHVDLFISNSPGGRSAALRREGHPPEKVAVCPQGIPDLPALAPETRRSLRDGWRGDAVSSDELLVICCVANFRWMKGHADLIRAFGLLKDDFPAARLVLAGDGPTLPECRALAEGLGLSGRVIFLGRVAEVAPILQASDLFALASRHEGLPTAILEAMAASLPIIATAWEGASETLAGVSLLSPPGDVPALAESLRTLFGDAVLRARLGEEARNRYHGEFRIGKARERMLDLYRKLLG
jgi:glycosyltransferase involved in cell wall biosynthesis